MKCNLLDCSDQEYFAFLFRKPTKDWFESCCCKHQCFLVDACLPAVLHISQRYASNTSVMSDVSKILARLMIVLRRVLEKGLALRVYQEDMVFEFVYRFWDYVSEAVCHDCVTIFESLIQLHQVKNASASFQSQWAKNIEKFLLDSSSCCRSRYRCILAYHKIMISSFRGFTNSFCEKLYALLSNPALVTVVCELITFDLVKNFDNIERRRFHQQLIRSALQSPIRTIRSTIQERLLYTFSRNILLSDWVVRELKQFLEECTKDTVGLEVSLYIGKFCVSHQKSNGNVLDWTSFINENVMVLGLLNANSEVRLMAWNLICYHPKPTASISSRHLSLCKIFLATNMAEQSPAVRLTILYGLKKLLIRIRESGQILLKNNSDSELDAHVDFICTLLDLCFKNLGKYANFSRRMMALKILEYVFLGNHLANEYKDLFWRFVSAKLKPSNENIYCVVRCLDDSYELCQISALRLLLSPFFKIRNFDFDSYWIDTKEKMLSIRSLFTLTSGYRLQFYLRSNNSKVREILEYLLEMCKNRVELISQNLKIIASKQGFVYSILNSLSVILELMDFHSSASGNDWCVQLIDDILLPMCFTISKLVAPVVNTNMKNFEDLKESTDFCQILLVSCWRSHRYVSSILNIIITKLLGNVMLSANTVHRISDYYWQQLTECKHCGAVETAVQGFETLCMKLWSFRFMGDIKFKDFPKPEAWSEKIISLLNKEKNIFCSMRRSAGLPYLVVSILSMEPKASNANCFKKTMLSLLEANGKSYKTLFHCMNIMRAIFSDSRLSEQVLCFMEPTLNVCFTSLGSRSWAVRSAASQLFAAMITRIFGVPRIVQHSLHPHQKNCLSSFEFFTRFPSFYDSLYQQFYEYKNSASKLRMSAVFILLTHIFPSPRHGSSYSLSIYILPLLEFLRSCYSMKLRELAAAALAAVCEIQDVHFLLQWISDTDYTSLSQNALCTVLLMVLHLHFLRKEVPTELLNLLMKNKSLRLEFWRRISKSDAKKIGEKVMQLAIRDFQNAGPYMEHCFFLFGGQYSRNLANLVFTKFCYEKLDFDWLYNCAMNEDKEVQRIAVSATELILKKGNLNTKLRKLIVLLLKNENEAVREKVANLCSYMVSPKAASLNPEILFWWFIKHYPEVGDIFKNFISFDTDKDCSLFDACTSNPYAEAVPIGVEYLGDVLRLIL
ncbi:unnamed protein product [Thelazia callipaeda]|uniref:tRNA (32-2'-O)-methyltransferase regulator THADA n=1 Tax=Thelazia callipaeda TaxID=103827 RepID=A0A0N5D0M6_THECL|nr:unnamed protein product [Thelazia callipaeda]